ncbi:hypothetical protein BD410DRAFT_793572 [Rickenella mellea]|uniref:BTB domain-containing protein n=1 Tax=Rickenella mellea TaxID=50990 RepID=A0A4Y7PRS5_9AGAM|nr:hypothetical protein BD410DRAFT_793572 [Rickenella mellea]
MDVDMVDGCQVVRMYDLPNELSNLLKAIYDGVKFQDDSTNDFFFLAGILRLSNKYFMTHLRSQAISHLSQTWTHTLEGHDAMVERALKSPITNGISFPYVHPIHVLNLAHETGTRVVLPSVLYFLSIYPFADVLRADHAKLTIAHPSKPSSQLAQADVQNYTLMYQHRIELMLDFSRRVCGERRASAQCLKGVQASACTQGFGRLGARMARSWVTRTGPLHWMLQSVKMLDGDGSVCAVCKREFKEDVQRHREAVWEKLPSVVGLPDWNVLVESDLPKLPM